MWRHALGALALWGTLLGGVVECQTAPPPERQADSMQVEIIVPRRVAVGQPVPMTLRIRNTKDQPITEVGMRNRGGALPLDELLPPPA